VNERGGVGYPGCPTPEGVLHVATARLARPTGRPAVEPTRRPAVEPTGRLAVEYVLPLRWTDDSELLELTAYLRRLSRRVDVTVVDGSPPEIFAAHAAAWAGIVRHLPPDPDLGYANGKVNGVTSGLRRARHEHVVIADDDVRYGEPELRAVTGALQDADLVRPQNYFSPLVWHARWDTARTLLNRCLGGDYPGTFGIRRSTFEAMGGYDGDVLFENLELIRTVRAADGREVRLDDVFVRRLPPDTVRFLDQRVRQAYDDLAQPARLVAFLSLVPVTVGAVATGQAWLPLALAAGAVAVAETGRRRRSGSTVFPASASLLAPLWLLERAVCGWLAVGLRATRGGVSYAGGRIRTPAHAIRDIRRRLRARTATPARTT
jgi:hypothetical protein